MSVSPLLFWVQQVLEPSWSAKNFTEPFSSLWKIPVVYPWSPPDLLRSSLVSVSQSIFFLWAFPSLPPHAEHEKVICSLCRIEIQTFVQLGQAWHCKSWQSVPSFIQDMCLLTLSFISFSMQMSKHVSPHQNTHAANRFPKHQVLCGVKCHLKVTFPSHWL